MSTPASRPRVRKTPDQRSDEIHTAAAALARESGLSALTLRSVATRAGVAPGLVAHYAGTMEELVARTFRELVSSELEEVLSEARQVTGGPARLARMIATVLRRDHNDITLVWVDAWSLGRGSTALSLMIDEQMSEWQRGITEIIAEGRAEGAFQLDDEEAVAWHILAMIDGMAAHALTRGTDAALFASRLAEACETLVGARPGLIQERLEPMLGDEGQSAAAAV